jgi:hypothetical protein
MKKIFLGLAIIFLLLPFYPASAAVTLNQRLSGRILLAVQNRGEAWYVNPKNLERYPLDDPFAAIREVGIGISNKDLAKIPLAASTVKITDKNQLAFINHVKGKIFLAVQAHGEAWYVNPVDGKRYFLITREGIAAVIQKLGLGISNFNLAQIPAAVSSASPANQPAANPITDNSPYDLSYLEKKISDLVNAERQKNGLPALTWNGDIAAVARQHSQALALENKPLTGLNKICDYFMIHHEGFSNGIYQDSRLQNNGIYYFSNSGENIAIQGGKEVFYLTTSNSADQNYGDSCLAAVAAANNALKASLESNISSQDKLNLITQEVGKRTLEFAAESPVDVTSISYISADDLASEIVAGWMNSPGHRANILRPEFTEAGIGAAYVNGYVIATQDFITKITCGYQGASCCQNYSCYLPNLCQVDNFCH